LWPGIDIDIPTAASSSKSSPNGTRDAVLAAFRAGADGVILSRKWSEMKSANLKGAGEATRTLGERPWAGQHAGLSSRRTPLGPFVREHAPHLEIDPAVVHPFGFPGDALARKAQPFGYPAALVVAHSAFDHYAVQTDVDEQVIEH